MDGPNTLGPRIHCSWAASSEGMGGNPPCKPRVDGFLSTVERYSLPSRSESLVRLIQRRPTKRVVHEKAARPGGFDQSVPCGGFSLAARSLASRSSYICVCVFRVSFRPPRRRFSSIKAEASAWVKPNSGTPLFNPRFGFQFCIRKRYPYFPLAGVARGWGAFGGARRIRRTRFRTVAAFQCQIRIPPPPKNENPPSWRLFVVVGRVTQTGRFRGPFFPSELNLALSPAPAPG